MLTPTEFSPSTSARWMQCPASIILNRENEDENTTAMKTGAYIQAVAGNKIRQHFGLALVEIGDTDFDVEDLEEICDYYLDFVIAQGYKSVLVNEKVTLFYEPESFGTPNLISVLGDTLFICDLDTKYEFNDPYRNTKLAVYARSFLDQEKPDNITKIKLCVIQPRLQRSYSWLTELSEILSVTEPAVVAKEQVRLMGLHGIVSLKPSFIACQDCGVRGSCRGYHTQTLPNLEAVIITDEEVLEAYEKIPSLKAWCSTVEALALTRAQVGALRGYEVGEGKKGSRKWASEATVAKILEAQMGSEAYVKSLITPTVLEKLQKKNAALKPLYASLQEEITQTAGKPSIKLLKES